VKHAYLPVVVSANSVTGQSLALCGNHIEAEKNYLKGINNYSAEVEKYQEDLGWGDLSTHVRSWYALSLMCMGRIDEAFAMNSEADARTKETGYFAEIFVNSIFLNSILLQTRQIENLKTNTAELEVLCERYGSVAHISVTKYLDALGQLLQGNSGYEKTALEYFDFLVENGLSTLAYLEVWVLAEYYVEAGNHHKAEQLFTRIFDFIESSGMGYITPDIYQLYGRWYESQGDTQAAEIQYQKAIQIAREQSAKWFELKATNALAKLKIARGESNDARGLLAPLSTWFDAYREYQDVRECFELMGRV
jgi:tetratricopeptide (TPR) repeat protein